MEERTAEDFYHFTTRFDRDNSDFWEENPDLKIMDPYRKLIKDEGPKRSAKIMDAIFMVYDPKCANQQGGRGIRDAQKEVAKYFLKDELFNWGIYKPIIDQYKKDSRTPTERDYQYYRSKVDQIKEHIDKMPLGQNAVEITDLMTKVDGFMTKADKFYKLVKDQAKEIRLRGGRKKSRVERRPVAQ